MDRHDYSRIRHSSLWICSPIVDTDVQRIGKAIGSLTHGRVIEIGCGKAEILARLMEATGSTGVGIDLPRSLAEQLSPSAIELKSMGRLEIHLQDANTYVGDTQEKFDVVIFSGASQAVGGLSKLPSVAKKLLKPDGMLVLGELGWSTKPSAEFLEKLEMEEADLPFISDVPKLLFSAGYEKHSWGPVPSNQFLQYESTLCSNGLAYAKSHLDDPEAQEAGEQAEEWFELMNPLGLRFFAFGWGLFRAPSRSLGQ